MIASVTADFLVIVHFAFIAFVILGGLLVFKWRRVAILHVPCALWGVVIMLNGWGCPLTPLERYFREAAGGVGYTSGFIDHYVMPLIYPAGLTRGMQISFGVIVIAVNLCVYGFVLVNQAHRKKEL